MCVCVTVCVCVSTSFAKELFTVLINGYFFYFFRVQNEMRKGRMDPTETRSKRMRKNYLMKSPVMMTMNHVKMVMMNTLTMVISKVDIRYSVIIYIS